MDDEIEKLDFKNSFSNFEFSSLQWETFRLIKPLPKRVEGSCVVEPGMNVYVFGGKDEFGNVQSSFSFVTNNFTATREITSCNSGILN